MSGWSGREEWLNAEKACMKGLFCDTYNIYLKYHGRTLTENEWDSLVVEVNDVPKKYGEDHEWAARRLALLVLGQIERENG